MENLNVKKTISERNCVQLIVNNFKFNLANKLKSGESRWRCRYPQCKAVIYTIGEECLISKTNNIGHNHNNISEKNLQKHYVSVGAKTKACEDITQPPRKIIQTILNKVSSEELTTDDIKCVKKSIYRERRKRYPKLPHTYEELHACLDKMTLVTNRQESFLLVNSHEDKIVVFSTLTNLKTLCKCSAVYMDGTFKYCPTPFYQLFTLHGYENGHYIPLVFCLLPDKLATTYFKSLQLLINKCADLNVKFEPSEIIIDFEQAIHKAVKLIWENIKIIGCRFHLSQAWWRKIQELGLTKDYKERTEIGKWIGYCFGLMFLDPTCVSDFLVFELMATKPIDIKLEQFVDYLVDTYIDDDSVFPPTIWASKSELSNRTTNACESFHAHLDKCFNYSHPNIFVFFEVLKEIQSEIYISVQSLSKPKIKNTKTTQRERYLKEKILQFNNNEITMLEYVKLTSHYYSL